MGAERHCAGNFGAALPGKRRRRSFEYRLLSHGTDERCWQPEFGPGTHTRQEWFNTSAFASPTGYTYGNEKVNSYVSQHFNDVDMSLFRDFHLGLGEERYFEFRAESFNLFNNVVWGTPDTTNTDPNFGQITGQRNSPRQLQMSLKFFY